MLCMASICSPTHFQIASCTRVAIATQHRDILLRQDQTLDLDFKASLVLSGMASNHTSMNYNRATLMRHYLTTGRKYALIKKYVLNKHVCLLTRLS